MIKSRMISLAMVSAALLGAAACREKPGPEPGPVPPDPKPVEPVTLTLSSELDTKTVLGDLVGGKYQVYWSDGDRICVNGVKSSTLYGIEPGTVEADFTVEGVKPPYHIVYPSLVCEGIDGNGNARVNLPEAQAYVPGSFASTAAMLYGSTEGTSAQLKNLCSVVRIPVVKGNKFASKISSLSISSSSATAPLSGKFNLSTISGELTAVSGKSSVMLSLPAEGLDLDENEPVYLYVALPGGEYPDGFNIVLGNDEGTMICTWTEDTSLPAGWIATLPVIGFKPDATKLIDGVDSWNEFAMAVNSGDQEQIDRWVNPETGVATLVADISYGGDLTQIENWTYTFNGNGHSIKRAAATQALFLVVAEDGVVRNLVTGGKRIAQDSNSDRGTGNLAAFNRGLIEGCVNEMALELTGQDKNVLIAGMVTDNAGVMKDCSNTADLSVSMAITSNRIVYGGGLTCRAQRSLDGALHSGQYINCSNSGNITIRRTSTGAFSLTKFAIGGIVGFSNQGVSDGVFTRIENCTNSGNISYWQDDKHTATNYSYAVGGIIGRCCVTNENTDFYYMVGGTSTGYNGYYIELDGCTNTGNIDVSLYSAQMGAAASGARQQYIGGIAGCLSSKYTDPSTIHDCHANCTIRTGHLTGSDCTGGIVGGAGYLTLDSCTSDVAIELTQTSFNLSERKMGLAGATIGYILRDATVKDCKSTLKYDGTKAKDHLGAGYVGAAAKHNLISQYVKNTGMATVTFEGTNEFSGTIDGKDVTSANITWPSNAGKVEGEITIK